MPDSESNECCARGPAFHFRQKASIPRNEPIGGIQIEVYSYDSFFFENGEDPHASLAKNSRQYLPGERLRMRMAEYTLVVVAIQDELDENLWKFEGIEIGRTKFPDH